MVALVLLTSTIWITCWTQEENARESIFGERRSYVIARVAASLNGSTIRGIVSTIYEAVLHLPKPVRRVCIVRRSLIFLYKRSRLQVQVAAFMGWFPFLFYSTTYVAEVMGHELGREPDIDKATRAGSLALLIYSFGEPAPYSRMSLTGKWPSAQAHYSLTSTPGTEDYSNRHLKKTDLSMETMIPRTRKT